MSFHYLPNLPHRMIFRRHSSRLFEPFYNILLHEDAIFIAEELWEGRQTPFEPSYWEDKGQSAGAKMFDCRLQMPLMRAFLDANHAVQLDWIEFRIQPRLIDPTLFSQGRFHGLANVHTRIISAEFILYYERYLPWIQAHPLNNNPAYPWPFATRVRNAIGHGNKVTIDDASKPDLTWYRVTIGPKQNGESLIGTKLFLPDVLILMIEMDHALDHMGHQFP